MKMFLLDEYEGIDEFMSDSNAGVNKGRREQDHLFLLMKSYVHRLKPNQRNRYQY